MTIREGAELLYQCASQNGVLMTLYKVFGTTYNVSIPFSKQTKETGVDILDLGTRAHNVAHRSGIHTVEELLDLVLSGPLRENLRGVGKTTELEIKGKLILFGYSRLKASERIDFWEYVLKNNKIIA